MVFIQLSSICGLQASAAIAVFVYVFWNKNRSVRSLQSMLQVYTLHVEK